MNFSGRAGISYGKEFPVRFDYVSGMKWVVYNFHTGKIYAKNLEDWEVPGRCMQENAKLGKREENFHFHDLRHVFGTELLKRGANPYHIKDLFAHTSMEVSAIYISSEMEQLQNTVKLLDIPEIGGVN